jgi:hypothetical protein
LNISQINKSFRYSSVWVDILERVIADIVVDMEVDVVEDAAHARKPVRPLPSLRHVLAQRGVARNPAACFGV